ncbi:2-oxoglutarate and iron-dependent oxygenase domain-containing protein [Vibrio sp. PP-XX7]
MPSLFSGRSGHWSRSWQSSVPCRWIGSRRENPCKKHHETTVTAFGIEQALDMKPLSSPSSGAEVVIPLQACLYRLKSSLWSVSMIENYPLNELNFERTIGSEGTENHHREIPVIDFHDFENRRDEIKAQLWFAASEIGFFQLVNHGLSREYLLTVFDASTRFLP